MAMGSKTPNSSSVDRYPTGDERSQDYLESRLNIELNLMGTSWDHGDQRGLETRLIATDVDKITRVEASLNPASTASTSAALTSSGAKSPSVTKSHDVNCSLWSGVPSPQSDRSSPITALWNFVNIRRFTFQAFLVWATLGIPGNIVTLYLFNDTSPNPTQPELPIVENNTEFTCHEVKAEWQEYVALSKLYIQGIAVMLIGIPGFVANFLSIIVLGKCKDNWNFHRLLSCLAIIDMLLITQLVLEMSVLGVFVKAEPFWYVLTYPYFIHPARGIIQTCAIFMVVAVATERYRAMCHPMIARQAYYKYILIVLALSFSLEFPRFFEMKLTSNGTKYWTTHLMENPYYVRFKSYWDELFATGFVPLFTLCYMNLCIFYKIKDSSHYALRFVSNRVPNHRNRVHQIDGLNGTKDRDQPTNGIEDTYDNQSLTLKDSIKRSKSPQRPPVGFSGAEYIRKRKEKSTTILVAIILVFLVCHIHRLVFRIYELALPEKALFEHYKYCQNLGRYHVPVAIYFLTHTHHLFLVINSSINFVIYCLMGRQFRKKLKKLVKNLWKSVKNHHRINH